MTVIEAYRLARTQKVRKPRKSYVKAFATWLAQKLPDASQVRTVALQMGGIGFVDYAAWRVSVTLGVLVIGVSLIVIEALSGE